MTSTNENRDNTLSNEQSNNSAEPTKGKVTHNLDTGEDEPLEDLKDESVMDFGSGSGGGSGGDGGAS